MDILKENDRVRLINSGITGLVSEIDDKGMVTVILDMGGSLCVPPINLELESSVPSGRDQNGRFVAGHQPALPNPEYAQERASAKQVRQNMLEELEPFFSHIGTYVGQIQQPGKRIDALAKMAPYILPALSRVEFDENSTRNISVELQLANFIKQQNGQQE